MTFTVIVDDSDPGIVYSGPWANVNPETLDPNEFGMTTTLGNTLHNSSLSGAGQMWHRSPTHSPVFK